MYYDNSGMDAFVKFLFVAIGAAVCILMLYMDEPTVQTLAPNQFEVLSMYTNQGHGPIYILAKDKVAPGEREKKMEMTFALDQVRIDPASRYGAYGSKQPAVITIDTTGNALVATLLFSSRKQQEIMYN